MSTLPTAPCPTPIAVRVVVASIKLTANPITGCQTGRAPRKAAMRRLFRGTVSAISVVLVLVYGTTACATVLDGKPVSIFDDPFKVAGLPATGGPSGLRDDALGPSRVAVHGDDGQDDLWALQAVSD